MGLLTDPSALSQKSKYAKILIKYNRILCGLLYVIGVVWFFSLADKNLNNGTYFSENALLPGLVYSEIRPDSSSFALKCLDELVHERKTYSKALPYPWLLAKMRQIGLETYTHNFTLNYPLGGGKVFKGKNVYGILRAPRIGSTESIVISVPYRPPESMHAEITHGVPLMLAFAEFARRNVYWAKDIIFLITEQEQLGMQAWLEAYHGFEDNSVLDSGKLDGRAGSIQSAINLEIQDFDVDFIDVKIEGLNGQLPNLDLVNLVQKLSYKENIPSGHKQRSTKRRSGLKSSFEENLKHMISMIVTQSTGVPTGNHGLFHRYGIEAITLEAYKKSGSTNRSSMQLLKILEGISRSLNNLLERFHQSFFFYVLVSSDRFISIGDYMPSLGLMAGSLLIKAFIIWLKITQKDEENKNKTSDKNFNFLMVGIILILAHSIGFLCSKLPLIPTVNNFFHQQNYSTQLTIFSIFLVASVLTLITPRMFKLNYLGTEVLHIAALLEWGTALICVGMLNFSLGLILSISTVPFAIFVSPKDPTEMTKSWLRSFNRLYCMLLHPLVIAYLAVLGFTWISFAELGFQELTKRALRAMMDALTFSVVDSIIYGNWMFNLVCLLFFPTWILFWNVIYPKTAFKKITIDSILKKDQ